MLQRLVVELQPDGLWLFGSWARGSESARSDIDLLIQGFEGVPVLQAYDQALLAIGDCPLPLQPLVAAPSLLARSFHEPRSCSCPRASLVAAIRCRPQGGQGSG